MLCRCSVLFLLAIPLIRAYCAARARAMGAGHLTAAAYAAIVWGLPPDAGSEELADLLEPLAATPSEAAVTAVAGGGGRADGVARVWIARRERQVCRARAVAGRLEAQLLLPRAFRSLN